ncbi:MAG: sterol desaturase family protein [Pseudomonadota bacterium]|nr:sterol desaturase family protein [Pseudomonadota bacterium]
MTQTTADAPSQTIYRRACAFALVAAALLAYMVIPDSRMYWPYMASAYFIGIFVYLRELTKLPPGEKLSLWGFLFPKEVWLHPSTFHDGVIALLNFALIAWVFDYAAVNPEIFQSLMQSVLHHLPLDVAPAAGKPVGWAAVVLYTVASLLLSELFYYISHRLTHTIPALWEFHKVHHSAEVMTPLTVYRMHPLDMWFNMLCRNIGLGLAAGVFLFFYPDIKGVITVAGVNIGIFVTNVVGANLRHTHIWMRFGRIIEHIVVSPAQHQIHHSAAKKHFDKNFGSFLSIWDWVFGSLYIPADDERVTRFGLGSAKMSGPYQSIRGLCLAPFKQFAKWTG